VLSNIYLDELDRAVAQKSAQFHRGKRRRKMGDYHSFSNNALPIRPRKKPGKQEIGEPIKPSSKSS